MKREFISNADEANALIVQLDADVEKAHGEIVTLKAQLVEKDTALAVALDKATDAEKQVGVLTGKVTTLESQLVAKDKEVATAKDSATAEALRLLAGSTVPPLAAGKETNPDKTARAGLSGLALAAADIEAKSKKS
jgi:chromosome segregation ATPase